MDTLDFSLNVDDGDARGFLANLIREIDKGNTSEVYAYYIDKDGENPKLFVSDSDDRPGMIAFFTVCIQTLCQLIIDEASEIMVE